MAIFVPILKEHKLLNQVQITVCIVGSRKISTKDDYTNNGWSIFAPNLNIYGFDADADACEAAESELASQQINWYEKHIPLALSKSTGESTLYVTKGVHCSSLYRPNESFTNRFHGMRNGFALDFTLDIETTTLDNFCDIAGINEIDFLQIDVQGADFDVLQGASSMIENNVLGLEIEVEFSDLYINQPLFSDIDIYLRNKGFSLFDLLTNDTWCRRPRAASPICSPKRSGQLLWADAHYLRDPLKNTASKCFQKPEKILKLACIADVLGYPDYTLELLEYLTIQYGESSQFNFARTIIEGLSQFPQLVENGLDSIPVVLNIQPFLKHQMIK